MSNAIHATPQRRRRTLDQELGLVREAIIMVATGGASRVVLAGLHFGARLIAPARRLAAVSEVRIVPLRRPDGIGFDIAIERAGD